MFVSHLDYIFEKQKEESLPPHCLTLSSGCRSTSRFLPPLSLCTLTLLLELGISFVNYKEILLLLLYATFCSVRACVSVGRGRGRVCFAACGCKACGGGGGEAVGNAAKFHCILLGPCDKLIWICVWANETS